MYINSLYWLQQTQCVLAGLGKRLAINLAYGGGHMRAWGMLPRGDCYISFGTFL